MKQVSLRNLPNFVYISADIMIFYADLLNGGHVFVSSAQRHLIGTK